MKKNTVLIIILSCLIFTNFFSIVQTYSKPIFINQYNGQTLFVGGSGPENYTKIQDAINDASNGDTIYVYEKIYYENLYVNKSINIIGQNRNNTIVDGSHADSHSILLVTDNTNVNNFTFLNDGGSHGEVVFCVLCDNCYISSCTIQTSEDDALRIEGASNNTFFNCSIFSTTEFGGDDAIKLLSSFQNIFINCEIGKGRRFGALISGSFNTFMNCSIYNNREAGVRISGNNHVFSGCLFYGNGIGFKIDESSNHEILNCKIYENDEGIRLWQYHPVNVTIRNCDIYNNPNCGVNIIQGTEQTTIDSCRIYNNGVGIVIADNSLNNFIINSTTYNNTYGIIILSNSNYNIIKNCSSYNNSLYGFYINTSNNNQIIDSTTSNNGNGTYIGEGCRNNILLRFDHLYNKKYGLFMSCPSTYSSDENSITYCLFKNNIDYAVHIDGYCFRNNLHHNVFIDVFKDVYDSSSNNWDNGIEGNYYSLYRGEDYNNDGIGDKSYYIGRYNFDRYPLMFTQMEDLKISITFPKPGFIYLKNNKFFPLFFTTLLVGSCNVTTEVYSKNLTDIVRVEFYIDDILKEVDFTEPFNWLWDEKSFGKHILKAFVYNVMGNFSIDQIEVWKIF